MIFHLFNTLGLKLIIGYTIEKSCANFETNVSLHRQILLHQQIHAGIKLYKCNHYDKLFFQKHQQ